MTLAPDAAPTTLRGDEVKVLLQLIRETTRRNEAIAKTDAFRRLYQKAVGANERIEARREARKRAGA